MFKVGVEIVGFRIHIKNLNKIEELRGFQYFLFMLFKAVKSLERV
jgi:hypothetical protein